MSSINTHVGKMIRKYRKAANLTLQQLADAIHKSRATICKYENGDISIDIETLYEISQVLQVSVPQLTDIGRLQAEADHSSAYAARKSPFFQAKMLYFYFYDGRYNRMKRRWKECQCKDSSMIGLLRTHFGNGRWCNQYPRKRREWQLPCDAFYLFRIREWKKQ